MDVHELYRDTPQSAREAGLRYLTADKPGITRHRKGKGFAYADAKGQPVTDDKTLRRIETLVIPPAWTDVWISPSPNGHLQATGRDAKGRKQYRYHPQWQAQRSGNKFGRLRRFGEEALPSLRARIEADLRRRTLDRDRVVAVVLRLLDKAYIRVGNKEYAKQNESYGLTTLQDGHVTVDGGELRFAFTGKKGVEQQITLHDRRLARLVKQCQDIPGQQLFQYYDETGTRHPVDSADVNEYIRAATGHDFTAKDFRTWGGTVRMVECLENQLTADPDLPADKAIRAATKEVAHHLGNTPTVCSKYYIHPQVVSLFKDGRLLDFLREHDAPATDSGNPLSSTERLVLRMLEVGD